ncbi:uncharacterized protein LOC135389743 [Ornithodoros turicata]|uniref:uncharacterized protein LOC135389743 n=1 Tax=Ornithodoros turicata TaxID=34597 RepID=UPI00313A2A96
MERKEGLKRQRRGLRSALSRAINEATEKLEEVDLHEEDIGVVSARVKKHMENLERVDAELELLWSAEEVEEEQQASFEYIDRATEMLARLQFRLGRINSSGTGTDGLHSEARPMEGTRRPSVEVKLPKLDLIKFNGQRKNWMAFWEQFRQVVHENAKLSACDKFNYLRTALTGEAASAISGLPPTERCYGDALEILKGRFGNESLQIEDHMTRLMDLQPVRSQQDTRGLRKLHDELAAHVRALTALGVPEESFSSMLYSLMLRLMPQALVIDFNRKELEAEDEAAIRDRNDRGDGRIDSGPSGTQHVTKVKNFMKFLRVEAECRERLLVAHGTVAVTPQPSQKNEDKRKYTRKPKRPSSASALLHTTVQSSECFFCKAREHLTKDCTADIPMDEKLRKLQESGRCFRCTGANHISKRCWRKLQCTKCQERHASSVCNPKADKLSTEDKNSDGSMQMSLGLVEETSDSVTVLQTSVAWCKGELGKAKCKVMFDTGSQRSFVTEEVAERLRCRTVGKEKLRIGVFGGQGAERTFRRVSLKLQSMSSDKEYKIEVLVTDVISTQRTPTPGPAIIDSMREKNLAVEHLLCRESRQQVQILVGADHYWDLVTGKVVRLRSSLRAVETRLGWTVYGTTAESGISEHYNQALVFRLSVDELERSSSLGQFWELEAIGIAAEKDSGVEDSVLQRFRETVEQKDGRYEVSLPYKTTSNLGNNQEVALKRLGQLTRRLIRNEEMMERYDQAIRMYSESGMAERVSLTEGQKVYYMPHQAVFRESSSTTKLRVVFDCSSSYGNAKSLNDCLESGPNLNPDVVELLLNFRLNKIALVADVEKAFLQIQVKEDDRDALRYLWYATKPKSGTPLPQMQCWRMTRVPFGTTASPFLLAATLRYHFEKMKDEYPDTAQRLGKHMYVDDLVIGAGDVDEAKKIAKEATEILSRAHMKLHKWASNDIDVRKFLQADLEERNLGDAKETQKVLGLTWAPEEDILTFSKNDLWSLRQARSDTKRSVLQMTARVYDPLGMLTPFTVQGRAIFQQLWKMNVGWDTPLPSNTQRRWDQWCYELQYLEDIKIPRYYGVNQETSVVHSEMHIFCDASPTAYGAVAYTVMENSLREKSATFLMAKARLAPLKELSIPRLELMACLVGARLASYLTKKLEVSPCRLHFWTDSKIALCWIRGDAQRWKQFVHNSVLEIQTLTAEGDWRHCRTKENPADMLIRGIPTRKLINADLWWRGPRWILSSEHRWTVWTTEVEDFEKEELEEKALVVTLQVQAATVCDVVEMEKYSSAKKLHHVVAWIRRFADKLQKATQERGSLTAKELQRAEDYCTKVVQRRAFAEEISAIQSGKPLPAKSTLQGNRLFIDGSGLLRLKGRLQESDLPYAQRHPVVLPKKNHYSEMLIRQYHWDLLHAGVRDTLVHLRERYWVVQGRQTVKKILKRCVVCQRFNARSSQQEAAPLPSPRVTKSEPFEVVGVDFAGPLVVKTQRSTKQMFFVIFVCATTRALHLELVQDMATSTFLFALRRFIARRGIPRIVYSDNAKTFQKSNKELKKLWDVVSSATTKETIADWRIQWRYNAPYAPWWGGFYERLIRSVKVALKKTIGAKCLNEVELNTIIAEIEAVLNSRPITYVYENENEQPLSPAECLAGKRLVTIPDCTAESLPENTATNLQRFWQQRTSSLKTFWERWYKEYLTELRNFSTKSRGRQLHVDDLVIIRKENSPRQRWPTGRIVRSFPGKDGRARVFEVQLPNKSTLVRPETLLYRLEV